MLVKMILAESSFFCSLVLALIICLNSLKSQEEGEFQVKITNIISKEVALGGYLFLETDGILITPNYLNQENAERRRVHNRHPRNWHSNLPSVF